MVTCPLKKAIISMIHTVVYAEPPFLSIMTMERTGTLSSWLQRPLLTLTSLEHISHLHSEGGRRIWERPDQLCVNTLVSHTALFPVMKSIESPPICCFQHSCPAGLS